MNNALYVNTSPDDTAFHVVPSGNDLEVYGRGKLVVWYGSDGGNQNAVKSYTVGGGIKTLVKVSQGYVWSVALSDDKMVWIVVDGVDWAKYRFSSAKLYWSPVPTEPGAMRRAGSDRRCRWRPSKARNSSSCGSVATTRQARVAGETDPTTGECPIFVVRLSTGQDLADPAAACQRVLGGNGAVARHDPRWRDKQCRPRVPWTISTCVASCASARRISIRCKTAGDVPRRTGITRKGRARRPV